MSPKEIVQKWVEAFNSADTEALADLYTEDAINHQVSNEPVEGKEAIRKMFADEFAKTKMICIVENIFEDGEWAILEWKDPLGLRGSGFFGSKTIRSNSREDIGTSCLFCDYMAYRWRNRMN